MHVQGRQRFKRSIEVGDHALISRNAIQERASQERAWPDCHWARANGSSF